MFLSLKIQCEKLVYLQLESKWFDFRYFDELPNLKILHFSDPLTEEVAKILPKIQNEALEIRVGIN